MTQTTPSPDDEKGRFAFQRQPCAWLRVSTARRGPRLRYACTICGSVAKTRGCPLDNLEQAS